MKIESVVLKRIGPVPFWRGETRCLDELDRIYRRAIVQASAALSASRNAGSAQARRVCGVSPTDAAR